jgi:hypothetical protein
LRSEAEDIAHGLLFFKHKIKFRFELRNSGLRLMKNAEDRLKSKPGRHSHDIHLLRRAFTLQPFEALVPEVKP